ncbi:PREDICTED: ninja-family protein AFP1-like [Nicotiana attenuata]|uniref:Ninja-family protein n=1 Tax=Nicotiana attenuata TaxID=49451 RepID=A0A1J6J6Z3_NICAT|nr:PREDICTED: ninja-family protein AFP1-like [Nicotiana attenuata]OIT05615.1 ninja-family protein afp1 [Nicotiana attenuata]
MYLHVKIVKLDSVVILWWGLYDFDMGDAAERRMENLSSDTSRFSRDLLQRFMGTTSSEKSELEDINEDELNLGLSLGGRFGVDKTSLVRSSSIAAILPTVKDDDALNSSSSSPQVSYNHSSLVRTSSLPVETEAEWRKRKELQSLRRMQAKRRRSEKVQRNLKGDNKEVGDEKRGIEMKLRGRKLEREQYLATAKKFSCGLPTLAAFGAMAKGKGSYLSNKMQGLGKPASHESMESQGGSSSSISELESKPAQGSAEASPPSIQSLQDGCGQEIGSSGTKMRVIGSRTPRDHEMESPCNKLDTTKSQVQETGANALGDMPCVFTKGDGPNGRRIDGILYKYGKGEEIRIMCVCHGSFLSPAEFVKHAGGSDVVHPLKHIVIKPNPSPFL